MQLRSAKGSFHDGASARNLTEVGGERSRHSTPLLSELPGAGESVSVEGRGHEGGVPLGNRVKNSSTDTSSRAYSPLSKKTLARPSWVRLPPPAKSKMTMSLGSVMVASRAWLGTELSVESEVLGAGVVFDERLNVFVVDRVAAGCWCCGGRRRCRPVCGSRARRCADGACGQGGDQEFLHRASLLVADG